MIANEEEDDGLDDDFETLLRKHQESLKVKSTKQEEVKAPLVQTSQANLEFNPAS